MFPRRLTIEQLEWIHSRMKLMAAMPRKDSPAPEITHHQDFKFAMEAMRDHVALLRKKGITSIELSPRGDKLLRDLKLTIIPA